MTALDTYNNPGWRKRMRVHRHNSFQGHAAMMRANLNSMLQSDSLTPEARAVALQLYQGADLLLRALKTRREPTP